jgi:sec-independent protein translocase protein TatA
LLSGHVRGLPENWRINAMLDNLFTPTHLIIILVIALLVFGPRKLPELGKGLGEGLKGFKEGIKGITNSDPAPQQQQTIAKSEAPQQPPAATQVK